MAPEHVGICYSGYREDQSPDAGIFPSKGQILEDLRILARTWRHLRLYDSGRHAELVLEVIAQHDLDFEIMLGAYITAEASNPENPWGGGQYSDEALAANVEANLAEVDRCIALAQRYPALVTSLSAGNEATVSWTDHLVPVERVIHYVRRMRAAGVHQPITFCENHVPWMEALEPLVRELDFISVHTYPVWEYRSIDEALAVTAGDVARIQAKYPSKRVVITEAGWTTRSNGRGIEPGNASDELQARYVGELARWAAENRVFTYLFEAFDEPWKGSPDPGEPEKHWGLFTVDRRPKLVMHERYPELVGS